MPSNLLSSLPALEQTHRHGRMVKGRDRAVVIGASIASNWTLCLRKAGTGGHSGPSAVRQRSSTPLRASRPETIYAYPVWAAHRVLWLVSMNWYIAELHVCARTDARMVTAFHRVTNLLAPPQSLLKPRIMARVLSNAWRRQVARNRSSRLEAAARVRSEIRLYVSADPI